MFVVVFMHVFLVFILSFVSTLTFVFMLAFAFVFAFEFLFEPVFVLAIVPVTAAAASAAEFDCCDVLGRGDVLLAVTSMPTCWFFKIELFFKMGYRCSE